jgi:hypothetical protein
MDNHSGRLVNDDEERVLIQDGQGKGFWLERKRFRWGEVS